MPSYLKALIVILVLTTVVFAFVKTPACAVATATGDFERRRNLWFAITLVAFLSHNFWIYSVVVAALLVLAAGREANKVAMYFSLLFAVPLIEAEITGLGIIRYFFTLHHGRLLTLAVLLPAFLHLRAQPHTEPFGRSICDKLLAGYLVLQILLMLPTMSFPSVLRHGFFYTFIDVFLPYYVASRALRNLQEFRDALMSFAVAAMALAAIAAFELWSHWLLYAALASAMGVDWSGTLYLERGDGLLRAQATAGQPIPLGYVMAVAVGLFLYLRRLVLNPMYSSLGLALLLAGLVSALSRGPWLGAAVMVVIFIVTGAAPVRRIVALSLFGSILIGALLASPWGDSVIRYLPFVGTVEVENVTGRARLFEIFISVMLSSPFFGAYDYMYAFEEMRHGAAGFIDFVNTYVVIGLNSGLVGLSLFLGFFGFIAVGIFRAMRNLADRNSELHVLGQALLSTVLGTMLIIFTTSSITFIPFVYWALAGIGVAYARMAAVTTKISSKTSEPATHLRPARNPTYVQGR